MKINLLHEALLPQRVRDTLFLEYHKFRMRSQDFGNTPPILIYQMGKVGSSTLLRSLAEARLGNPLYHVHHLSDAGIKAAEDHYLALAPTVPVPRHIRFSRILRTQLAKKKDLQRLKIITLVRDPIARQISDLFQSVATYFPSLLDSRGTVRIEAAVRHLNRVFAEYDEQKDYAANWFDRELRAMFGIDVYSQAFSHESGFTVLREGATEVLVLRLEDLDRSFQQAILKFLDLSKPIQLMKTNIGSEKRYAAQYASVLKTIVVPAPVCTRIYSSKYARHFYTEAMRDQFINRWSTGATGTGVDHT